MLIEGNVVPLSSPRIPNGLRVGAIFDGRGALVVSQTGGRFETECYNGNVYSASLAAAAALPLLAGNLTATFGLWNRGPNKICVPVRFVLGYNGGVGAPGTVGYAYAIAGSGPAATGAVITSYVNLADQPQMLAGGVNSVGQATSSAVVASGVTLARWSPISQGAPAATTTAIYQLFEDFDGSMMIPPGVFWCPVASAASVDTFFMSLTWKEIPL